MTLEAFEIEGHGIYWELYVGQEFQGTYETEAALDAAAAASFPGQPVVKHTLVEWLAQQEREWKWGR
jgi:hypothetical protein